MIVNRQNTITLTGLGRFTNFITRYLPHISNWLLLMNRNKIERQFTLIGGQKVAEKAIPKSKAKIVFGDMEA
jgi:hypothetical protein